MNCVRTGTCGILTFINYCSINFNTLVSVIAMNKLFDLAAPKPPIVVFTLITSAKEVMFHPCLFFCVFCQQDYAKRTKQICTKLGAEMGLGTWRNLLNFSPDPVIGPVPGDFLSLFLIFCDRAFFSPWRRQRSTECQSSLFRFGKKSARLWKLADC